MLLRRYFSVPYVDMDTGFRLFRKSVVDELAPSVRHLGFFTAEFVVKSHDRGYKILEIPVNHFRPQARPSNIFHLNKLPGIIYREFKAIHRLWKEIRPIHVSKS